MTDDPAGELGEPIARGRAADVYDLGDGTVLRRIRDHDVRPAEVAAMRLAEAAAFPVPHVYSVTGPDLVLDRIDGRDMLALLGERPWRVRAYGRTLADLHVRLRSVAPDDRLAGGGPRESLVHGDLHPGNVLLAADGPVVIDWENARAGPTDLDAATTWLLLSAGEPDHVSTPLRLVIGLVRRALIGSFLRGVGRPSPATVDLACDIRLGDRNLSPTEHWRLREFKKRHGTGR